MTQIERMPNISSRNYAFYRPNQTTVRLPVGLLADEVVQSVFYEDTDLLRIVPAYKSTVDIPRLTIELDCCL